MKPVMSKSKKKKKKKDQWAADIIGYKREYSKPNGIKSRILC